MKEISLCLLVTLCFTISAFCQEDPVSWTVNTEASDEEVTINYTAAIDEGWYVYSQDLERDLGPVPTSIHLETKGITPIGEIEEIGDKKESFDEYYEMKISKYAKELSLVQKINRIKGLTNIKGYIEYMTCDDNRCLPPKQIDFEVSIK